MKTETSTKSVWPHAVYSEPELITHSRGVYWFVQPRGEKWHLLYRAGSGPLSTQGMYWTRQAAIAAAHKYCSY